MHQYTHIKQTGNTYMSCNKHFIEWYSWAFGCLEGVTVGIVYESIYCNCCFGFDVEEAEHGFKYGVSETVWCCGIL